MGVNKVILGDETLLDLTGDTVTEETLKLGVTAHNAAGEEIVGTLEETNETPDDWDEYKKKIDYLIEHSITTGNWDDFQKDPDDSETPEPINPYPIGSIYLTVLNIDPSKYFGGEWVSFGPGKVLVGVDPSDSDFKMVEIEGGNKSYRTSTSGIISDTSLTIDQIPNHTHGLNNHAHSIGTLTTSSSGAHVHAIKYVEDGGTGTKARFTGQTSYTGTRDTLSAGAHTHTVSGTTAGNTGNVTSTGGGSSHTHDFSGNEIDISTLQPYITCYMWKRIA